MDPRRRVSTKQERSVARRKGARLHAGSGSGLRRHDMDTETELIECKTVLRGNTQITIKAADLKSLTYHAAIADKTPVMHIELQGQRWKLVPDDGPDDDA